LLLSRLWRMALSSRFMLSAARLTRLSRDARREQYIYAHDSLLTGLVARPASSGRERSGGGTYDDPLPLGHPTNQPTSQPLCNGRNGRCNGYVTAICVGGHRC
jgi:hypothetical protein